MNDDREVRQAFDTLRREDETASPAFDPIGTGRHAVTRLIDLGARRARRCGLRPASPSSRARRSCIGRHRLRRTQSARTSRGPLPNGRPRPTFSCGPLAASCWRRSRAFEWICPPG